MAMNLSILINPDDPEFSVAWASFFLNPEGVRLLLQESDLGLVTTVLSSGLLWDGSGWNTAKATARLFELTRVALVTDSLQEYLLSFLFLEALAAELKSHS